MLNNLKQYKPKYHEKFDVLVKRFSQFGGGREEEKFVTDRVFSSANEMYIYSFFLGLKLDKKYELVAEDRKKTFNTIESWSPKDLADYLLALAIHKSEVDITRLEHCEEKEYTDALAKIKRTIESYANGGLQYLQDMYNKDPESLSDLDFFIDHTDPQNAQI